MVQSGLVLFRELLAKVSWRLVHQTPEEAAEVGRIFKIQGVGNFGDVHGGVDQKALGGTSSLHRGHGFVRTL
jgi:hypothetical protein